MPEVTIDSTVKPTTPAAAAGTPTSDVRPANLPEKFKDVGALVAAYAELEAKQSGGKPPAAVETPAAVTAAPAVSAEITAKVETAGIDLGALSKEYTDNGGKLTDATIAALAAKGITQDQLATYVAGANAKAAEIVNTVTQAAGGPEALKAIYAWAGANVPEADLNAYNEIVKSGNVAMTQFAFNALAARYQAATGKEPVTVSGRPAAAAGVEPFTSNAQVTTAMRDPKYKTDPAYRASVAARLAVSNVFGGSQFSGK